MRSNYCLTVFYVSILAILMLPLEADSEDTKCETEIRVRRNTVYKAFVGQDLRISCLVVFCNNSPRNISWFKLHPNVPVNVSSGSHIKKVWKTQTHFEGTSYLIFLNIVSSDSGQYRCHSGGSAGHSINVSVYAKEELTTAPWNKDTNTWTTLEPVEPTQQSIYCVVGIMAFVFIVLAVYVTPKTSCKGDQN